MKISFPGVHQWQCFTFETLVLKFRKTFCLKVFKRMIIDLKEKTAWVGGASSGLGRAIAYQLAESGATVIAVSRNEERLKTTIASLPKHLGQQHQYLQVNFDHFDEYKKIADAFFQNQNIDILINNTGGPPAGNVLTKTDTDFQNAFSMLFQTVQYTTSKALPGMVKKGYGRIINLTSRTVKEPAENLALSNTIRAAVTTWGKTLANAVAKDNITVNNILTGNFDTERLYSLFQSAAEAQNISIEEVKTQAVSTIPARRLGRPEELANFVTFLASEQASYITGTSIAVDGGMIRSL